MWLKVDGRFREGLPMELETPPDIQDVMRPRIAVGWNTEAPFQKLIKNRGAKWLEL
jgi:hypothetical protein